MKTIRLFLFIFAIALTSNGIAQTVYTTKTGEKYHKSNCRYLKQSKKETTIKKAKAQGYQACKVCKPTEINKKVANSNVKEEIPQIKSITSNSFTHNIITNSVKQISLFTVPVMGYENVLITTE
jgi:methylphosphotriester-DNA--protein-cysteine methyltransferase